MANQQILPNWFLYVITGILFGILIIAVRYANIDAQLLKMHKEDRMEMKDRIEEIDQELTEINRRLIYDE